MDLERFVNYIDTYSGRDKVMRLIYYFTQYGAGVVTSESWCRKINILGEQLSNCRVILRLFDDIPMLRYTLTYGWGSKEQDKCMQFCGVITNAFDQLYYPLEHVAWAADLKLLPVNGEPWWTASSLCWAISTYLTVIKSLRYFFILQGIKRKLKAEDPNPRLALTEIFQTETNQLLTAARCFLDFIHAVHWLPKGTLWAGKLKQWQIGVLGILSSLINLYQS